jgi:hypothetical protein
MMSDWFHDLPLVWMAVVVFGFTYLLAGAIHVVVHALAVGERARAFKSVSPGMLPPLGIVFGQFVGFTAAQVWSDSGNASAAVDREASALRSVVLLKASFPGESENHLRALVANYIEKQKPRNGRSWRDVRSPLRLCLMPCSRLCSSLYPCNPSARANRSLNTRSEMPWKTLWMLVGSA